MLVPLGRGGRGDDSCRGSVVNGGLWWPKGASKSPGFVLQLMQVTVASLESRVRYIVYGGVLR